MTSSPSSPSRSRWPGPPAEESAGDLELQAVHTQRTAPQFHSAVDSVFDAVAMQVEAFAGGLETALLLQEDKQGVLHTSVEQTAAGLGANARLWRGLFEHNAERFDSLAEDVMRPLMRMPSHPVAMARFGLPTLLPATVLGSRLRTERARALFGGVAAHAYQPLHRPLTSAIGLGILTAGHHSGWVVAQGGSGAIPHAIAARPGELGARIETGVRLHSASELPASDVTMLDLAPEAIASILGDRLPPRVHRGLRRFRRSPGAFKVDFAVEGGVPWRSREARLAGTVHLGGDFAETVATERAIAAGQMPERPFVLVGQQYLADPQRSVGDVHPIYSYAHVPHGFTGDATEAIIAQFERFAPGFRDRVVGMRVRSAVQIAEENTNFVGGDIITGAKDIRQLILGPRLTASPYTLGLGLDGF